MKHTSKNIKIISIPNRPYKIKYLNFKLEKHTILSEYGQQKYILLI